MAVLPDAVTGAVLCTDGSAMLAAAARHLGLEHHGLNTLGGEGRRGAWHIQNVNAYIPPAEAEANYYRQLASQPATVVA